MALFKVEFTFSDEVLIDQKNILHSLNIGLLFCRRLKQRILFIVNPISGGKGKAGFPELLQNNLDHARFESTVWVWENGTDATARAELAVSEGYDAVAAVGGDGTVHAVARALVHTSVALVIIPMGSGNGLARYLKIPLNTKKAIQSIGNVEPRKMDMISFNGLLYSNVAGVGFDAHIGACFAKSTSRGLWGYVKSITQELFHYKSDTYSLNWENGTWSGKAFLISIANGAQWGNNAWIAPSASCFDGLMQVAILKPFSWYQVPGIALALFRKTADKSSYFNQFSCSELTLKREDHVVFHLDGEPLDGEETVQLNVLASAITLWH